ncbi:hypothetical protein J31TS4_13530 [Paenibacillus sp. J31TS4]|uniref:S-layer homology domain-containing protein n=1 Tax=Paenibacillus sp. J31TS4 TaxID=2807195 RepID=UPI001B0A6D1C|nr:S-layer homology domain-containing protein [Paenibacillus sp. J31TS4]GIP38073.1 hypothetical protein J31TS4_13530 [Paenibacillus sp. J31TS4]
MKRDKRTANTLLVSLGIGVALVGASVLALGELPVQAEKEAGVAASRGTAAGAGNASGTSVRAALETISFRDTESHWAKSAITEAARKGYVDGYEDGSFRPEGLVTRAEFLKMAATAMNLSVTSGTAKDWYVPYVNAAVNANIHRYHDFTTGDWNTPITRQEMARIAVRATDKLLQNPAMQMDDKSFVFNATKRGLMQGLAGGELGLEETTTRAQSVTIIERILSLNSGKKLEVDKAAQSAAEIALTGTNTETMWGFKIVPLPLEAYIANDIKMVIDQVLVVDMTDSSSYQYDMFKDAIKRPDTSVFTDYVLAYHISVTNEGAKVHDTAAMRMLLSMYPWNGIYIKEDLVSLWLDQEGPASGWICFSQDKNVIDEINKSGKQIALVLDSNKEKVWISKKGK